MHIFLISVDDELLLTPFMRFSHVSLVARKHQNGAPALV